MGASSQSESNENPITAYEKREYFSFFSEPYHKPSGMLFLFSLQLHSRPPPKKIVANITFRAGGPLLLTM